MAIETLDSALTTALYAALGNSVTYVGQSADTATLYAIVDTGSVLYGQEVETSEAVTRARLKVSDVATPRRGDRIEMADGTRYQVDGVDRLNNVEWEVTLTELDR